MKLKYLKKLRPIINKVGLKHGIPTSEGEYILGQFFDSFNKAMNDPRIPKVILPLIGIFYPKISYINRSIKASFRFFRSGGTTKEYMKARVQRIWHIRRRLQKEEEGEITWKDWRKEEVKEKYKELVKNEERERTKSREVIFGSNCNSEKSKRIIKDVLRGLHKKDEESGEERG